MLLRKTSSAVRSSTRMPALSAMVSRRRSKRFEPCSRASASRWLRPNDGEHERLARDRRASRTREDGHAEVPALQRGPLHVDESARKVDVDVSVLQDRDAPLAERAL